MKSQAHSDDSLALSEEEAQKSEQISWIEWHCSIEGHEFLIEVDPLFIKDHFNQSGLKKLFPNFNEALKMILGDSPESEDLEKDNFSTVYQQAVDLYGLLHCRYIQTPKGLQDVRAKYQSQHFGVCQRVQCASQSVLPIGLKDELSVAKVKVYCPKCEEVFVPKGQRSPHQTKGKGCKVDLDGAYFGHSFPQLFLQQFPHLVPEFQPPLFVPKIYGFKVSGMPGSASGQQQ